MGPLRACRCSSHRPIARSSSQSRPPSAARSAPGLGLAGWLAALALAGCGDSQSTVDAGPDTPSPCARGELFYTGELIDWVSSPAMFHGVFDATFTVENDAARTDKTSPNGRFEVCLASAATTRVSVDPTAASTFFHGLAVAEADVIKSGVVISMRSFTAMRETTFTPRIALGKAQVFVDLAGAQREVNLPVSYEAALAFDGTQWAAGRVGKAVFFTNVDVSATPTAVSMSGSYLGGKTVPLVANVITYVTVVGK